MAAKRRNPYESGTINEEEGDFSGGTAPALVTGKARQGEFCIETPEESTTRQHRMFNVVGALDTDHFIRVFFKYEGAKPTADCKILRITPNNVEKGYIAFLTTGKLGLFNAAGTKLAETATALTGGTYYAIGLKVKIPTTGKGVLGLYLNGVKVFESTEEEMGATVVNTHLGVGKLTATASGKFFFDEIAVNDSTGTAQTGMPSATSRMAVLKPAATKSRTGWKDGAGGTTALHSAVKNTPPVGVADANKTATSQIYDPENNATDTVQFEMQSYLEGGLQSEDTIMLVRALERVGNSSVTARRINIKGISNPEITELSEFSVSATAAAIDPTGWVTRLTAFVHEPTIVKATKPVIQIKKGTASTDSAFVDQVLMLVEYEPAMAPVQIKSGGLFIPAKRSLLIPGELSLVHEDPMTTSDWEAVWGDSYWVMKTPERVTTYSSGGDKRPKGDGTPSNERRRVVLLKDGDRSEGDAENYERAMMGANDTRYGEAGEPGTFALFHKGDERMVCFTLEHKGIGGAYPVSTSDWNLDMQMKQGQPYSNAHGSSPILAMQTINNNFVLVNNDTGNTVLSPFRESRKVRFIYIVKYGLEGEGHLRVIIDDRAGLPTDFVPQYDTGVLNMPTMSYAVGAQTVGSPSVTYADGQAIPSFFNLGVYRNGAAINGEVSVEVSNVQNYNIIGGGGGWVEF